MTLKPTPAINGILIFKQADKLIYTGDLISPSLGILLFRPSIALIRKGKKKHMKARDISFVHRLRRQYSDIQNFTSKAHHTPFKAGEPGK